MAKEKFCGIYCIENLVNGKKYIGQAANIFKRLYCHKSMLNNGTHFNKHIQKSFTKYGENNFKFYIIEEECLEENLDQKENYYINYYNTINPKNGYNLTLGGGGIRGYKHSEESKKRNSEKHKGKPSPSKGILRTLETRQKMSKSRIGVTSPMKGKKHKKESIEKMANSQIGKKASDVAKIKMSEAHKKQNQTEETKDKRRGVKKKYAIYSKYVGITYRKNRNTWMAQMTYMNEAIYLGTFKTEIEAALAYNECALEHYGWKAKLNKIPQKEIDNLWKEAEIIND